jgi:hypothetical protein
MVWRLTLLVLFIYVGLHYARVNNENEIGQRLVVIWTLILPALIEEAVKFIPLL